MKLNISKARGLFRNEARISTMSSWQRGEKAGENHPLLFFPCPPVSALEGPRTIAARVALAFISSHAPRLILIPVRQRDVIRSPLDPCDNSSDSGLGFDNVDVQLSVRHAPGHLEREVSTPDSLRPWPEEVSIWTERTPRGRSLRQKPEAAAWGRSLRQKPEAEAWGRSLRQQPEAEACGETADCLDAAALPLLTVFGGS